MSSLCCSRSIDPFCLLLVFLILCVTATVTASADASSGRLLDSEVQPIKSKKVIASSEIASAKPKEAKTVGEEAKKSKKVEAVLVDEKSEGKVKKTKGGEEEKGKKVKAPIDEKVQKLKVSNSSEVKLWKKVSKEKNGEPDAVVKKQRSVDGEVKVKTKVIEEDEPKKKAINATKTLKLKPNPPLKNITRIIKPLPSNQTKPTNTSTTKTKIASSDLNKTKTTKSKEAKPKTTPPKKEIPKPWTDADDDDGLLSQMRDLPSKFNQIIPDIQKISSASRSYLTKANKEMTKGIKPIVGNRYASTVASFISLAFIIIPLILSSLIFHHIKTFFSLQKILIFIQAYLAIYFSILCVSALVTGLEPLKFFFATSKSTYLCVMVLQTLAYGLYMLLLMMYTVLVFSTETTLGSKGLGLAQMMLGLAVGVHFYVAVVHRVAIHQPPQTNWKIHGVYAVCFAAVCGLAALEKRKKAYLEESGQEGKRN